VIYLDKYSFLHRHEVACRPIFAESLKCERSNKKKGTRGRSDDSKMILSRVVTQPETCDDPNTRSIQALVIAIQDANRYRCDTSEGTSNEVRE
jgi:hypothetical protein